MAFSANFSKTAPAGSTPYSVLKLLGIEAIVVVILTVVAGTGSTEANFAIGLLAILWLLLLVSHDSSS